MCNKIIFKYYSFLILIKINLKSNESKTVRMHSGYKIHLNPVGIKDDALNIRYILKGKNYFIQPPLPARNL
jgi:hypothetical protein